MISSAGLLMAFSAILAFTVFGLLARVLAKGSDDPLAFAVVYSIFTALFSLLFLTIEPWRFSCPTIGIVAVTFVATVLAGAFEATEFFARKHLEASRSTILFQITPVVTFFASILILREGFSLQKLLAVALIVAGNLIAVYKHGGNVTRIGLLFGLAAPIALGLEYVADKAAFSHYPIPLYMVMSYGFPALYIFAFLGGEKIKRLRSEFGRVTWKLSLLALVSVIGYYLVLKTFQLAEASVAVPIIFTSTIFTALGGILILRERSGIPQKVLGAIFVVAGVILIR